MRVAIAIDMLTKYYPGSKVPALLDVSLEIKAGEVYGFLGSNGAGKSTAIRLMLDFLRPTSGTIRIYGKDSVKDSVAIKHSIGYLSGDVALTRKVTGRQLLHYLGRLNGGVDETYLASLEKRFEAELDKRIDALSKGNRQKIGLIQAFMSRPKVLILDEPTSGLDPLMQEQFYSLVAEVKADGAAVFLSSHSFTEVERICDSIGIIREGKMVYEGSVANVTAHHKPAWHITLSNTADADRLAVSPELTIISRAGRTLKVSPARTISAALEAISKVEIIAFTISQDDLESEFMSFYLAESKS